MIEFDERTLVGSGAFANVYRVTKDGEVFALKEIENKSLRDREAQFIKLANHPLFPTKILIISSGNMSGVRILPTASQEEADFHSRNA